ncbi:putative mitochondrial hypothetical protein [Leptomonas pyrrhocoris]|uniref:Uncharacterized protein n=1 Tax=Leptomonas pyrrhocoris TaxID=157538 RepID=A0A0M9FRP4_LEPPY|nr:putative mitochondrial hypothetical protein [Leptomonas pyrrhocoris]KPA74643.1 putative mitochondrial hypothetical protein [Leptomonas pyrrhocoris]|eukprot:XP_015653082.1 putative mitochondrial hypothetical protein [Leptomonas pyrrhocoris]
MLHSTAVRRINMRVPTSDEIESDMLINRLRRSKVRNPFSLRALTGTRLQGFAAAGGIILGAAVFLGPWMLEEYREMLGNKFVPLPPSQMPHTSPEWWENEWRKMNSTWRAGESTRDFFVGPYSFVKEQTGRDLSSAMDFVRTSPTAGSLSSSGGGNSSSGNAAGGHGLLSRGVHLFYRSTAKPSPAVTFSSSSPASSHATPLVPPDAPQMLVPLCGDSPILRTAALQGFEVDGVDSSQTALRSAVERSEEGLPVERFRQIHLHWKNFFAPELWEGPLKGKKYDVIYERQGMTSLNREQRPDYAYLLKRALKDDGLIYVEGIFRTGRVKGNKLRGPPYSLSKKELEHLFPLDEGFYVRCEEKTDAMQLLSRENRILKRVPKELYVTPFRCAVFREAAVNLATRAEPLQHPEPPALTPSVDQFTW